MITLDAPFTAQTEISSDSVVVLQNIDEPTEGKLRSLVELGGNPSLHYWIPVYGDDVVGGPVAYNSEWMDEDVEVAVKAWFAAQA